jgi:rhamnosyltransferase
MESKVVDLIIPVYRPGGEFLDLVQSIRRQTYPIGKIWMVHTKGGTFPWQFAAYDERICVIEIEKDAFDHGATRRMAVEQSQADFFCCMTQDAIFKDEHALSHLMDAFTDERVGCAYARQLPRPNSDLLESYTRMYNYPPKACKKDLSMLSELGIKTYFCSNVCAAYRRSAYNEAGGFEPKAIFNEDMILTAKLMKLGYICAYQATAQVIHSHNYSSWQQFQRNFDLAVSQTDHPEIFRGVTCEQEGIRMVLQTAKYVVRKRKPWLVASLVWKSGWKYLGFRLGRMYQKLPRWFVKRCSSNPTYWRREELDILQAL